MQPLSALATCTTCGLGKERIRWPKIPTANQVARNNRWLETTFSPSSDQESEILVWAGLAPPGGPEGESAPGLSQHLGVCWPSLTFLGYRHHTPISGPRSHNLLCVSPLLLRTLFTGLEPTLNQLISS